MSDHPDTDDIKFDDAEQQKRRGSAASWAWKSIAQVIPGLMLRSVGDKSRESSQGYDPRPQEEREQKTILASVLDRVATVIAKVEAKIDAGPRVSEQKASQALGITPEAVRQHAPELGIPYETAKTGEVSFRKNQLRFAAVPAEAERLPLGIEAATMNVEKPAALESGDAMSPGQQASREPQGLISRIVNVFRKTIGGQRPASAGQQAAIPQSQTTAIPDGEPVRPATTGDLASLPADATVGMAIRGVENQDSVIHRLSQSAQQAFGLPRSSGNSTETQRLSPGEAAAVPPGAKVTVEIDDRARQRRVSGESGAGDHRTFARRIMDRLLPVPDQERQQRGQAGVKPSRAMRYRNVLRGFGIRGKRAARQLSRRLGQSSLGGSNAARAGQRGLQAASTTLGSIGRTAAVTGTGAAIGGAAATAAGGTGVAIGGAAAAGGTGAAVGGAATVAGTGAAVGGGAAAAAGAGPIGIAVAVVGLLVAIVPLLKSFARNLTESNRGLAAYNGTIAGAMARLDVRRFQNQVTVGGDTQQSAADLAESVGKMETALTPLRSDVTNFLNTAGAKAADIATVVGKIYENTRQLVTGGQELVAEAVAMALGGKEAVEELKKIRALQEKEPPVEPFGKQFAEQLGEIMHAQIAAGKLKVPGLEEIPEGANEKVRRQIEKRNADRAKRFGYQMRDQINPQWEERGF